MQNETATQSALREFITRVSVNLSALIALVAGLVNLPDLVVLLMP